MRISDWSSDVCSSDLRRRSGGGGAERPRHGRGGAGRKGGNLRLPQFLAFDRRHRRCAFRRDRGNAGAWAGAVRGGLRERVAAWRGGPACRRSEEHTSELQSLIRISYAVFCLKKKR